MLSKKHTHFVNRNFIVILLYPVPLKHEHIVPPTLANRKYTSRTPVTWPRCDIKQEITENVDRQTRTHRHCRKGHDVLTLQSSNTDPSLGRISLILFYGKSTHIHYTVGMHNFGKPYQSGLALSFLECTKLIFLLKATHVATTPHYSIM